MFLAQLGNFCSTRHFHRPAGRVGSQLSTCPYTPKSLRSPPAPCLPRHLPAVTFLGLLHQAQLNSISPSLLFVLHPLLLLLHTPLSHRELTESHCPSSPPRCRSTAATVFLLIFDLPSRKEKALSASPCLFPSQSPLWTFPCLSSRAVPAPPPGRTAAVQERPGPCYDKVCG